MSAEILGRFGTMMAQLFYASAGDDFDAVDVQRLALDSGVVEWVKATEPCGANCLCANVGFPQDCLRMPDSVRAIVDAAPPLRFHLATYHEKRSAKHGHDVQCTCGAAWWVAGSIDDATASHAVHKHEARKAEAKP